MTEKDGNLEKATFAAGCFWGVQAAFDEIEGVVGSRVGYTGGKVPDATYPLVCSGTSGHAEAVELEFDPFRVTYRKLLESFFDLHNPTTRDRQGPDIGSQYRSAVFFHDEAQKREALAVIEELDRAGKFGRKIVTLVAPAGTFWAAEEYHQRYYAKKGGGSCRV